MIFRSSYQSLFFVFFRFFFMYAVHFNVFQVTSKRFFSKRKFILQEEMQVMLKKIQSYLLCFSAKPYFFLGFHKVLCPPSLLTILDHFRCKVTGLDLDHSSRLFTVFISSAKRCHSTKDPTLSNPT